MDRSDQVALRGYVLGNVQAGEPFADPALEDTPPEYLLDELKVGPTDYFLRVRGSSMKEAGIEPDDLVQIRPIRRGDPPSNGAIVLAEIGVLEASGERTGQVTIKRFFREGARIRLQPANSSMESREFAVGDVNILGVIVKVIRQLSPT
jgi:repressor LexA